MTDFDLSSQGQHFDAGLLFETMSTAGIEYISKKNPSHDCWLSGHRRT
jgi:hypothetical protein